MNTFKRFSLFFATNIAIIVAASIVLNLLGIRGYLTAQGINYQALLVISFVWGMAGAFISLLLSKKITKWTLKIKIIDRNHLDPQARMLVNMVERLASKAGLSKMPEVGIYDSPEINAFATGPSKSNSLVAFSTGIIAQMSQEELEGVAAHEVSHIANGDMVTMTLIQGVMNAFVIFLAKVFSWAVAQFMRGDEDEQPSYFVAFAVEIVLQIIFGILASIIVNWFSRQREFRADSGSANLAGREKMIAALQRLQLVSASPSMINDPRTDQVASLKISGKKMSSLFSTHPDLSTRIERLKNAVN